MPAALQPDQTHYAGPPFDQAQVHDAMRVGVVACRPDTPLRDVARIMVGYRIHSVVVEELGSSTAPWGIVSALDVAAAGPGVATLCARDVATTDVVTIPSNEPLSEAARLMSEHRISHLVVVQPDTGRPAGVISASALAAVLAAPRT